MTTIDTHPGLLDPSAVAALAAEIAGAVLLPGDEGYEPETHAWNLALSQRPALVVAATSAADVRAAVRFADRHDRPVAVLATGHGALVPADGAVLINTRRMNGITIDAAARTAEVGAGVEWQQVVDAAAGAGLAPLAGSSPNVGVVGYTLGGGLSPTLGRRYGWAADHVVSIEVVTPDGELRVADATHEPELFWALRGGKANFGVVTAVRFALVPLTRLYGGGLFFDGEHVTAVLDEYRRLAAAAPDELTVSFAFLRLPDLPFVPPPLRERFSLHVRVSYLGSAQDGERLVAGLRAAAPALLDTLAEMPFTAIAAIHADPVDPLPTYERSALLADLPAEAVAALVEAAGPAVATPLLMVEIRQLGGALGRPPAVANAVSHREARFQVFAAAVGAPGQGDVFQPAIDGLIGALRPWTTGGTQPNFLSAYDTDPRHVRTGWDPRTYERLVRAKQTYDPRNLFRVNHNITA